MSGRIVVTFCESMKMTIFGYESFGLLSQDARLAGSKLCWLLISDNYTLVN